MREYQEMVPDAAERIFRMAEARTVDASRRQDQLAAAEIEQTKADRNSATVFMLMCLISAIVFFSLGNNFGGAAMVGLPVLAVIKAMFTTAIGRTKPSGDD